jgi:Cu2+-containing amine oxidase
MATTQTSNQTFKLMEIETLTIRSFDRHKWIKDLLESYENKTITQEEFIQHIDNARDEAYAMGYNQKTDDLAADDAVTDGSKLFSEPGEEAVFEEAKQEWFKSEVDMHVDGEQNSLPGLEVVENDPRRGSGVQGQFHVE